jgi:branched-chain amino acid transport system permease protein
VLRPSHDQAYAGKEHFEDDIRLLIGPCRNDLHQWMGHDRKSGSVQVCCKPSRSYAVFLFLQQLINGLALGSIYALISIGYTMVYGVLFFVNFPHGEFLMVGTFLAFVLITLGHLPFGIAAIIAMLAAALVGVSVEKIAYSRLRFERRLAPLLSAMGVSIALQNGAMLIFGPQFHMFPTPPVLQQIIRVGELQFPLSVVAIMIMALVLMLALEFFLRTHRLGIGIRATSDDITAARLMGINLNTVISLTFAIGSALAAAGGILLAVRYGPVYPTVGFSMMIKAFIACVLGGIGNTYGAVLGSFIIGIAEALGAGYISSGFQDGFSFIILILVLLFRPTGLLGGRSEVRV